MKRRKLKAQAPDCHVCKKRGFWSHESADFFRDAFFAKRFYKCKWCGLYHLTNKKYKRKQ